MIRIVDWVFRLVHEVLTALMREAMLAALDNRKVMERVGEIAVDAVERRQNKKG